MNRSKQAGMGKKAIIVLVIGLTRSGLLRVSCGGDEGTGAYDG